MATEPTAPVHLTNSELETAMSILSMRMFRLRSSGDYPEAESDKILFRKLNSAQFHLMKGKMKGVKK